MATNDLEGPDSASRPLRSASASLFNRSIARITDPGEAYDAEEGSPTGHYEDGSSRLSEPLVHLKDIQAPSKLKEGLSDSKDGVSYQFKMFAFIGQVALTCSVALITQASKHGAAHYHYNTLTVPFYSEVLKMGMSAVMAFREELTEPKGGPHGFTFQWPVFLAASVPALLYLITNNFNFIIIHEIGALSFQILNNFKIVSSAIIFQIVMKRQLSAIQWRGVLLLTLGSLISQLKDCGDGGLSLTGTTKGYILKTVNCTLTSFAGVYCEKFLKHTNYSIHWQNLQLYFWGALFATISMFVHSFQSGAGIEELWRGHNLLSITLIFNYASVGLATAFVLKYLDNIAKNFAAVTAMFVAALAAYMVFGEPLSLHLLIGLVLATMAAELYVKHNTMYSRSS
mmetsp:Transcript_19329/g.53882  ORF Transcript_19329/g.53882 Transcript_19329/m.53882 type:complete len:398 (-) Transcript_19329:120-1313(-)|eukprot:CAMPEP_0117658908 /NCGR_PEP_ID=MMETSP0804-20121206/6124_1 /TAXON_ID=1074897 /ORGANISM="Tetraselmis astigmatica, Strain CCMP880" /LENGTH=397 /DNA_ID=CAMNT_0005465479 /DNA_START=143 /DNA_END=1336 /DNA_ORIENTATION=+